MSGDDLVFWASQPASIFRAITVHPQECDRLFAYLLHPDTPSKVVYTYVVALKDHFHDRNVKNKQSRVQAGFDAFDKITIKAGIVKTLFRIASDAGVYMERVFTSYFAAEGLWELIQHGTPSERRELVQTYLDNGIVDFCLNKVKSAPFVAHRVIAGMGLRTLAAQCYLGEYISAEKTSEIIKTLCQTILGGPGPWIGQLKDPATTWQSLYCFGSVGAPTSKARRYAPRWYAMHQETAVLAIVELLGRYPPPSQEYCNKIIQHDPGVLDLMLKCAKTRREAWYAQLEVDARMSESLVLLVNTPQEIIPGLKIDVQDHEIQQRLDQRWEGLMDGIRLLTSRPGWAGMIVDIWNHIGEENVPEVESMLKRAKVDYFAQEPYEDSDLLKIPIYRGTCRIAMERLTTTITHAFDRPNNNISENDLLNLLQISHAACQYARYEAGKKDPEAVQKEMYALLERRTTVLRNPGSISEAGEDCEKVLQINSEAITGPTCHLRLLTCLAKAGLFEKIQQWDKLPHGVTIPGGLPKLKTIASYEDVQRCLVLSHMRIANCREVGNKRFTNDRQHDHARFEYWSAAQLAFAIVEFDDATNRAYHHDAVGAGRELVLCLGNAAEMELGKEHFERALVFGSAAVHVAEIMPPEEEIGDTVREKNKRRVERARTGIQMRRL